MIVRDQDLDFLLKGVNGSKLTRQPPGSRRTTNISPLRGSTRPRFCLNDSRLFYLSLFTCHLSPSFLCAFAALRENFFSVTAPSATLQG